MTDHRLAAQAMRHEAKALGIDLAALIVASGQMRPPVPTVTSHIDKLAGSFTPGTARTYRPYWRLAARALGDRRLDEVTIADLQAVVDEASDRARRRRPNSTGRASRETCVAALRALFARAVAAGVVATNPARSALFTINDSPFTTDY